jgi:ElaB/YqjD/DUF883 family membrane-anchored ribosome-binding protein
VKENPMPALLIGAGIVWWMLGEDKDDSEQFEDEVSHAPDDLPVPGSPGAGEVGLAYEQSEKGSFTSIAKDKAGQAKEALSSTAEAVTEKMSNISSSAHAAASSAANVANEGVRRTQRAGRDATEHLQKGYVYAGDRFQEAVEEYPLAVALGFLGVGILTGLLLPRTQQEDKLLGEKSDQLIEHVEEAGIETLEKAKTVAERVADATVDEAKRQGVMPEAAGDKISDMAKKIRAAATQAKEETLRAAEEEQLKPPARTEGSGQSGEQTGA